MKWYVPLFKGHRDSVPNYGASWETEKLARISIIGATTCIGIAEIDESKLLPAASDQGKDTALGEIKDELEKNS